MEATDRPAHIAPSIAGDEDAHNSPDVGEYPTWGRGRSPQRREYEESRRQFISQTRLLIWTQRELSAYQTLEDLGVLPCVARNAFGSVVWKGRQFSFRGGRPCFCFNTLDNFTSLSSLISSTHLQPHHSSVIRTILPSRTPTLPSSHQNLRSCGASQDAVIL